MDALNNELKRDSIHQDFLEDYSDSVDDNARNIPILCRRELETLSISMPTGLVRYLYLVPCTPAFGSISGQSAAVWELSFR
jgi:hypothetical protein